MSKREHDDLFTDQLICDRERKPIQDNDPSIAAVSPLGPRFGELEDHLERRVDLILELGAKPGLA